jgi:hypothetical protein
LKTATPAPEFLVKSVNHNKPLRVHAAAANHRPVCSARVPKFKHIIAWQLDPGPANCKVCAKILQRDAGPKLKTKN